MNLALFDLDNTLLAGDSDHAWGQFLCDQGVVDAAEFKARNDAFYEQYKAGTLNIFELLEFVLEPMTRFPRPELDALHEAFFKQVVRPMITPQGEALVREHPTNDYYANAFAKLCSNRVGLLQAEGDVDGALAVGEIAIQTRRAMAARRPDSAEPISGLGGALHNFARAVRTSGDHERAYALVEEAVRVQREARRLAPSHPTVKRFLRFHFWSMIEMDHDARDDVAATTHVDELIDVDREDSETWRIAATVLSRGAALARDDATLDATTRQRWFEERLARARECFKEAVAHGLDDASRLDDRDLDALRADPAASALFDAVRQAAAAKPRQP